MSQLQAGRRRLLQSVGVGAATVGLAGLLAVGSSRLAGVADDAVTPLDSLFGEREWLTTEPLRAADLEGKVVLVNFWTYSCINSLRPLPYLKAWAEKYADRGLVVVGVHTPEFRFEHDAVKVSEAASSLGVSYPVVQDNDYEIWRSFGNQAWPGFYFVGADGRVRHRMLGEGDYGRSEQVLQQLLSEIAAAPIGDAIEDIVGDGVEAPPDWASIRSLETYVGYRQAANFASRGGIREDAQQLYEAPASLSLNRWGLGGAWTVGREFATLDSSGGTIAFRFHARDLHMVLGRGPDTGAIRFRVLIDGASPGGDHGVDTDTDGWGSVEQERMYQLVRQAGRVTDRTFSIEFQDPGVRAYVFTFG